MNKTTTKNRAARRDRYVPRIMDIFHRHPIVTNEMVRRELGLSMLTAATYMNHMYRKMRVIRKVGRTGNATEWELGEDRLLPGGPGAERPAPRTVAARQIGMHRDPLVAALFGPAVAELRRAA